MTAARAKRVVEAGGLQSTGFPLRLKFDRREDGGYHLTEWTQYDDKNENRVMTTLITRISTEGEGVGYGTHVMVHPKCHKSSIGCDPFMSKVFNE